MKFQPSRRAVLKGAGGVALGLPLLEMTSGKGARGLELPKWLGADHGRPQRDRDEERG